MGTLLNKNEDNCRVTRCHVFGHVSECINCLCRDITSRAVSHLPGSDCFGCAGNWHMVSTKTFWNRICLIFRKNPMGVMIFWSRDFFLMWGSKKQLACHLLLSRAMSFLNRVYLTAHAQKRDIQRERRQYYSTLINWKLGD
jgi:hypothetical protein